MNEIEARGKIKYRIANEMRKYGENKEEYEDLEIALQALKEIREYREIGSVEEFKAIKQWKTYIIECFCKYDASSFEEIVVNARKKAIDEFAERLKSESYNGYATLEDYCEDTIESVAVEDIVRIAEQLKGGATDDRTGSN